MSGYIKLDTLPRDSVEENLDTAEEGKLLSPRESDEMSESTSQKSGSPSPTRCIEQLSLVDADTDFNPWASWFGGRGVKIGPRTAPVLPHLQSEVDQSDVEDGAQAIQRYVAEEAGHAIQYRTCSWPKTAALMFSEYIGVAILTFPWSYSVLGLVPGIMLSMTVAASVLYTSLIIWDYCLRHPEVQDISDIGQMLFGGRPWAWYATTVMFLLNNTFIQGIHIQMGAEYLNTMVGEVSMFGCQTAVFAVLVSLVCWICSVPRTFSALSKLGTVSAAVTFLSVLLATVFAGVQKHPAGYPELEPNSTAVGTADALPQDATPIVTAWILHETTTVRCITAIMNIAYLFIGHVTVPSFMAEMKEPRDFPKALWVCTIGEAVLFALVGSIMYAFIGNQYMTSPAFGSLRPLFKTISFSLMVPTIMFVGVLFASITGRFIFFRVFRRSRHMYEHTLVGWGSWVGILLGTWIVAFLIAELVPFFSSLVSLTSSLFDGFFGFIFWAVAFFRMRRADRKTNPASCSKTIDWIACAVNVVLLLIGALFLTAGTWASIQDILDEFVAGKVKGVFSCAVNPL